VNNKEPLYNSRIARIYLEYLEKYHPHVDRDALLDEAGMTHFEVNDHAHWLSQDKIDRFHDVIVSMTGDPDISRAVGRYAVSAESFGRLKQWAIGMLSMENIYLLMEKNYSVMSRGAAVKVRKLSPNRIEITATPNQGVNEKPFQCQNRMGIFESLARIFTKSEAKISPRG
jgi:hypothetical protein